MIGWQPRKGDGPWHLTEGPSKPQEVTSLCGVRVAGVERYVRRDPHKIDRYDGEKCPACWSEWKLRTAASLARQDQHFAAAPAEEERDG